MLCFFMWTTMYFVWQNGRVRQIRCQCFLLHLVLLALAFIHITVDCTFVIQRWNEWMNGTYDKYFIYVVIFDVIEMSQRSQPHTCWNPLLTEQCATEKERILFCSNKNFQVINYKSRSYSIARHTQVWHVRSWCSSETHIHHLLLVASVLAALEVTTTVDNNWNVWRNWYVGMYKKGSFIHCLLVGFRMNECFAR